MEFCDVGNLLQSECSSAETYQNLKDLDRNDYMLLKHRLEKFWSFSSGKICKKHKNQYLDYYSAKHTSCCNPFQIHMNKVANRLSLIEFNLCKDAFEHLSMTLVPGKKLCRACKAKLCSIIEDEKTKFDTVSPIIYM